MTMKNANTGPGLGSELQTRVVGRAQNGLQAVLSGVGRTLREETVQWLGVFNFQLRSKRIQKGWSITRKEEMVGSHGDGERPTPAHVQMRMVPVLALHREAERCLCCSPAPCDYQLTHRKLVRCIRLSTPNQDITCGYTSILGFSAYQKAHVWIHQATKNLATVSPCTLLKPTVTYRRPPVNTTCPTVHGLPLLSDITYISTA